MNWKAEFSKAGELALLSGTLLLLGWGLFLIGKGFGGGAVASPEWFNGSNLFPMGMLAILLPTLFFGYRGNRKCAVTAAFMLGLACSSFIGAIWGDYSRIENFPIAEFAEGMFIASLIWVFGLLLLWLRSGKKILSSFAFYVLVCVPVLLLFLATESVTD